MPDILFQYPLDLTGAASSNAVNVPVVLGGGKVNRAFAFPAGPFFADTFRMRPANQPNTIYKRGTDYELIYIHPAYMKLAKNREICMGVVVTNPAIPTDIVCLAQVVGGPQSAVISAIKQALADANLEDRKVDLRASLTLTPSINLPAPGRHHTLYVHFRVCRVLCF